MEERASHVTLSRSAPAHKKVDSGRREVQIQTLDWAEVPESDTLDVQGIAPRQQLAGFSSDGPSKE